MYEFMRQFAAAISDVLTTIDALIAIVLAILAWLFRKRRAARAFTRAA